MDHADDHDEHATMTINVEETNRKYASISPAAIALKRLAPDSDSASNNDSLTDGTASMPSTEPLPPQTRPAAPPAASRPLGRTQSAHEPTRPLLSIMHASAFSCLTPSASSRSATLSSRTATIASLRSASLRASTTTFCSVSSPAPLPKTPPRSPSSKPSVTASTLSSTPPTRFGAKPSCSASTVR